MNKNIEELAADIGSGMLENGAEISRVEDTITRIIKSQNIKNVDVFCISSGIIISTQNGVVAKRIKKNDLNLFEIDRLNSLSRAICNKTEFLESSNRYPLIIQIISVIFATGSFCLYFGGNIYDAVFSGLIGLVINFKKSFIYGIFARTFCDSLIAGILSFIPSLVLSITHPDKIMIGVIMLLIPGLTVSNAIRDIMSSDVLSGVIELTEAVFTAFAISLGFAAAVVIFK